MQRASHFIEYRQFRTLWAAVDAAQALGKPLNLFVTINFSLADCPEELVSSKFGHLRENHFSPWLRYVSRLLRAADRSPPLYIWVIENRSGMCHVHWLVHMPPRLKRRFEAKVPDWVAAVCERVYCSSGVVQIATIYDLEGLRRYVLKGVHPNHAARHRLKAVPQGIVVGKRCGVSKSLGPAAIFRPGAWLRSSTRAGLNASSEASGHH